MKSVGITLREADMVSLERIKRHLVARGLMTGNRSMSQCIRYALDIAVDVLEQSDAIEEERAAADATVGG